MNLHEDLLQQAAHLAIWDPKKPKQTNLRRAVSAAYYALFHFLVDQACASQIGASHDQRHFRNVLARGFNHTTMKSACRSFGGGSLPAEIRQALVPLSGAYAVPIEVQELAAKFVELQEERHRADYDLTARFARAEVNDIIREVQGAIYSFTATGASVDKRFFLACLWAWKQLTNR